MTATPDARKAAYNAELTTCPGHEVLVILGARWATLLLEALADGPRGHADLGRQVAGATQKMLTQTLRLLERDGLVTRTVAPTIPPRVDYQITALGKSLFELQHTIRDWGGRHIDEIHTARHDYDRRTSGH